MADGNKVIYEVRADDSNLEKDLNRAEQNIRKKAQGGVDAVKKSAHKAWQSRRKPLRMWTRQCQASMPAA